MVVSGRCLILLSFKPNPTLNCAADLVVYGSATLLTSVHDKHITEGCPLF